MLPHEVKTPLSIIKVYVQGIEDGFDDGTYLDVIHDEIHKIDGLIENLLLWFKIGREENEKERVDLFKIINENLHKYKLVFDENKLKVDVNICDGLDYFVFSNKDHINMVFENLLTNAIKYSNDKRIEIFLNKENEKIKFRIINGIDKIEDDMEKIWIPFYVLEKSRDKNFSGTGLGLPIVKEILEKY